MSTFQPSFPHQHLLGIEGLKEADISQIIDLADKYVDQNRQTNKKKDLLEGQTQIIYFLKTQQEPECPLNLLARGLVPT